jgi:hypothetical protein
VNNETARIESIVGTSAAQSAPTRPSQDEDRQRTLRIWFYVGVPLVVGFMLGWTQVGRAAEWPKSIALLYWVGFSFGSLYLLDLGTRPIAWLLRPRGVPLWITLVIGQLAVGWLAILPLVRLYTAWIHTLLPAALTGPLQSSSFPELLQRLPSNLLFWAGLNLFFFYALGMARFGYAPPLRGRAASAERLDRSDSAPREMLEPTTAPVSGAADVAAGHAPVRPDPRSADPAFLSRVRADRQGELLALQADGHYLRVFTVAGSDLILYRFGDALAELNTLEGMRVHRSWWVAERAIEPQAGGDRLRLVNGLEVPVSRSYRLPVRERGWL